MARESTEIRGRAQVRPFRVGQVVDVTSAEAVRAAIINLTSCWGGYYMPILNASQSASEIAFQARLFDVDALHCEFDGDLVEQLRTDGWLWGGRGEFGPFTHSSRRLRPSILPATSVAIESVQAVVLDWDADDPLDLFFTAVFGTSARALAQRDDSPGDANSAHASLVVGLRFALMQPDVTLDDIGVIHRTQVGVAPQLRYYLDSMNGVFVVRPDTPRDLVDFWNLRAMGRPVVPLPADGPAEVLEFLTRVNVPGIETRSTQSGESSRALGVWGLGHASESTHQAIAAMGARLGMPVGEHLPLAADDFMFPGLESRFRSSVRADFPSGTRSITMRVPNVPLALGADVMAPGIVAVEVDFNELNGLDPRLAGGAFPRDDGSRACCNAAERAWQSMSGLHPTARASSWGSTPGMTRCRWRSPTTSTRSKRCSVPTT